MPIHLTMPPDAARISTSISVDRGLSAAPKPVPRISASPPVTNKPVAFEAARQKPCTEGNADTVTGTGPNLTRSTSCQNTATHASTDDENQNLGALSFLSLYRVSKVLKSKVSSGTFLSPISAAKRPVPPRKRVHHPGPPAQNSPAGSLRRNQGNTGCFC